VSLPLECVLGRRVDALELLGARLVGRQGVWKKSRLWCGVWGVGEDGFHVHSAAHQVAV